MFKPPNKNERMTKASSRYRRIKLEFIEFYVEDLISDDYSK